MKKKLTYRDKLLELAKIYNVKEVTDYIKNRKNLTSGQLELILKKNKIIIPKEFNTTFFKENVSKPLNKFSKRIDDFKEDSSKKVSKVSRRIIYFKEDSSRSISSFLYNIWKGTGKIGIEFLNIFPKLASTYYSFFTNFFTELFHGIYDQQINKNKTGRVVLGFFMVVGVLTLVFSGVSTFKSLNKTSSDKIVLKEVEKKEPKKNLDKQQKEVKKPEKKVKKENKKKEEKVTEVILPDLNLKTETVLSLFKDVNYDLNKVRYEKKVKPIYFTQFPKDLDEIQSVKLKIETFIKIVLPLIVAENEKILDDRYKLEKILSRKITTDEEKQWLRQKFLEYKVKKGSVQELKIRMDIIPTSIALAQAAKESGWGTSRFALEGNAIFGQWTWSGTGIAPLLRDKTKNHKILKFPILRASVKAYKNNLNTHKSYDKFREKRKTLRDKKTKLKGMDLTSTLENYAETGNKYVKTIEQIITQNRLSDFEPVRLTSTSEKKEFNL